MLSLDAVVLLPSYQPEETLINLSRGLTLEGFKVLIVDDGSGPKYQHIFEGAKQYATVITYAKNRGKGDALKYGFEYCLNNLKDYKYVITADGDGQHSINDIHRIYDKVAKEKKSVIGVRRFEVKTPIKSRIGNMMSKFNQSLATYQYMHDNQCGLRGFTYEMLPKLINIRGSRYEYEMNVLTFLQTKEIPFLTLKIQTIYENNNAGTHFRPIADTLRIQSTLLLAGLISFILYLLQATSTFFVLKYVEFSIPLGVELAVTMSFLGGLILSLIIKIIVFRPMYPGKLILRNILYELLCYIAILVSATLFTRILGVHILLTYLICYVLTLLPKYYLIKGIALVYETNTNDE